MKPSRSGSSMPFDRSDEDRICSGPPKRRNGCILKPATRTMHSSHTNRRTRFAQPDPLLPSNAAARPSSQSRNRPAPDQPGKARIHRVRFVDYRPSAICSLALTPSTWDASTAFSHSTKGREVLAVGKGNGDIEIHVFVGIDGEEASKRPTTSRSQKQAWVIEKVCSCSPLFP